MTEVFISVGSNIKPEFYVPHSLLMLSKHITITGISTFYLTPPLGGSPQPDYWNGVVRGISPLPPEELIFSVLHLIEASLGRTREEDPCAPRTVDLDLLLYGDLVKPELKIPHPDIYERDFLIACLYELEPELVLPDTGKSIRSLKEESPVLRYPALQEFTEKIRKIIY